MNETNFISIQQDTLAIYQEKAKFYDAVNDYMLSTRNAGYDKKFGCIAAESIPVDGDFTDKLEWLQKYLTQSTKTINNLIELRKSVYGASTEKSKHISTDDIISNGKYDKAEVMTEEEYNNKLQLYRERIKLLGELLDKACNSSVKDINECDRLSNQLLAVKKLEEELVKNRANVVASRNEKNEELKNDSQNKTEPSEDSQKKISNE